MNTDKVLSISAIMIALAAVGVSIWQSVEIRKHNRFSLAPYIVVAPGLTGLDGKNGVFVENNGTGSAFIINAEIVANGKVFDLTKNSWPQIYKHLNIKPLCHSESWFPKGSVLKAGMEHQLIGPTKSAEKPTCRIEFVKLLSANKLQLNLEYQSIYEEEFQYQQRIGLDPQEIKTYKQLLKIESTQ